MPEEGALQALDIEDGRERWNFVTPALLWRDSLTVTLDSVLLSGGDGRLLALSTRYGLSDWEIYLDGEVNTPPLVDRYVIFAVTNAVAPEQQSSLYALNASTGATLWHFQTPATALTSPARGGDLVYVSGTSDETQWLYAISATEGTLQWERPLTQPVRTLYANDTILAALFADGRLMTYAGDSGEILWELPLPNSTLGLHGTDQHLIIWDETSIAALELASGKEIWRRATPDRQSAPLLRQDEVYYLAHSGELIALQLQDGEEIWRYGTGVAAPRQINIQKPWLFISDAQGRVYAFGEATP